MDGRIGPGDSIYSRKVSGCKNLFSFRLCQFGRVDFFRIIGSSQTIHQTIQGCGIILYAAGVFLLLFLHVRFLQVRSSCQGRGS